MSPNTRHARWAALPVPGSQNWALAQGEDAVLDLIQWVCAHHPAQSRAWLRQKILLSSGTRLTPLEQTAVRVFAKRTEMSAETTPPQAAIPITATPHSPDPDLVYTLPTRFDSEGRVAQYLQTLLNQIPHTQGDRAILALALDAEGRPLGIARARNGLRRDAHAEWVLLQTLSSGARTRIAQIWTTLKPCRFCATLLYPLTEQARVTYLAHDPGPWGRATCLDADSPDRKRFYPSDSSQRERLWKDAGLSSITSTNS